MIRAKYWQFLTKSYVTKIFKSRATNWYIVSQNEASLHSNVSFELKNLFFKDTNVCYLKMKKEKKLTTSRFPETILLTTQKKIMSPYQELYFCAMDNITR